MKTTAYKRKMLRDFPEVIAKGDVVNLLDDVEMLRAALLAAMHPFHEDTCLASFQEHTWECSLAHGSALARNVAYGPCSCPRGACICGVEKHNLAISEALKENA